MSIKSVVLQLSILNFLSCKIFTQSNIADSIDSFGVSLGFIACIFNMCLKSISNFVAKWLFNFVFVVL